MFLASPTMEWVTRFTITGNQHRTWDLYLFANTLKSHAAESCKG